MTTILIATTVVLAVAVAAVWHLAATLTVANQLIAAQRRGIALREQAIEQQQQRISLLVTHTGALEDLPITFGPVLNFEGTIAAWRRTTSNHVIFTLDDFRIISITR